MIDLTNIEQIKQLDPKDVYGSTGMLSSQCKQIWQDGKSVQFSEEYKHVQNVVICGMGGSAYGGHVVKELFKEELPVPVYVNSDYSLPGFVNQNSLVVLTSYSGSTEETVTNGEKALALGAKVAVLTSGGKLAEFKNAHNLPGLVFTTQFNPSTQPRLGTGYVILGTIALFNQLGLVSVSDETVSQAVAELETNHETITTEARDIANKLVGFIPVMFAADFLVGNAHIMRNQFNETSKSFSAFSEIPELNHHLMEGLKNPEDKKLTMLMINSNFYTDRLARRFELTKEVVEKNNVPTIVYNAAGTTKLSQMFHVLAFGGYVTVYLGLLYGLDPSLIPWVDYFKAQLAK